ncbi:MAG: hypothetical protein NVS4B8_15800 [Herpetosiphon sp.]
MNNHQRGMSRLSLAMLLLLAMAMLGGGYELGRRRHAQRLMHVAQSGVVVMPFALDKTRHHFEQTDDGGVQTVLAIDSGDAAEIQLIREHLQHETDRFTHGHFSDPARIHGTEMAGLSELQAGAGSIKVEYKDVPKGGEIRYVSNDVRLVRALHRWFAAQVADHGTDDMPVGK